MKKMLIVEDEPMVALDLKLTLTKAGYKVIGIAHSVAKALEMIVQEKPQMVLLDIFLKGDLTGIDLAKELNAQNIPFVYLSANFQENILEKAKITQPYGFMVKPFREKELLITLDVAFYRHQHSIESMLRRENNLKKLITQIIQEPQEWEYKLLEIAKGFQTNVPFDYLSIIDERPENSLDNGINFFRTGFEEYQTIGIKEFLNITHLNLKEFQKLQSSPASTTIGEYFNEAEFNHLIAQHPLNRLIAETFRLNSMLSSPLMMLNGNTLKFTFYSRKPDVYLAEHITLLSRLSQSLSRGFEEIMFNEEFDGEPRKLDTQLNNQKLEKATLSFPHIIGKSHQILSVLDIVSVVAPLNTSVLILGETGTGKELIAKALHVNSNRSKKPFIKVNCATLPAQLIESELFGHERGSFTGAFEKKIGKFELAEGGSIFLDEVGELAFDLQAKLLRVLQEKEFERIGGNHTFKCDVRIITATNRVLEKEIEEGRFRSDLYYRLSVFPIQLPPLRERQEDIVLLSNYFVQHFSEKMNKSFRGISDSMLDSLTNYNWPGNIRELENVLEQAVILNGHNQFLTLSKPLQQSTQFFTPLEHKDKKTGTLTKSEKEKMEINAINNALQKTRGRIRGATGAAALLGINPTTLESKMKKYEISRYSFDRIGE